MINTTLRACRAWPIAIALLGWSSMASAQFALVSQSATITASVTGSTPSKTDTQSVPSGDLSPFSLVADGSASTLVSLGSAAASVTNNQLNVDIALTVGFKDRSDSASTARTTGSLSLAFDVLADTAIAISLDHFNGLSHRANLSLYQVIDGANVDLHLSDVVNFQGGATTLQAGHYLLTGELYGKVGTSDYRGNQSLSSGAYSRLSITAPAVPEPATWMFMGLGMLALMPVARRQQA